MLLNLNKINEITIEDKKNIFERTLKLAEEIGEVSEAIMTYGNRPEDYNVNHIIEEAIDSILVIASLICVLDTDFINRDLCYIQDVKVTESYERLALILSIKMGKIAESLLSSNKASGCEYKCKSKDDLINELIYTFNYLSFVISKVKEENNISSTTIESIVDKKISKWETKCTQNFVESMIDKKISKWQPKCTQNF